MSDLIDRQRALSICDSAIDLWTGQLGEGALIAVKNSIAKLPSTERKKGKWIQDGHHIQCNQCGISICDKDREGDVLPKNFCPNCGSYNGGDKNDI